MQTFFDLLVTKKFPPGHWKYMKLCCRDRLVEAFCACKIVEAK